MGSGSGVPLLLWALPGCWSLGPHCQGYYPKALVDKVMAWASVFLPEQACASPDLLMWLSVDRWDASQVSPSPLTTLIGAVGTGSYSGRSGSRDHLLDHGLSARLSP